MLSLNVLGTSCRQTTPSSPQNTQLARGAQSDRSIAIVSGTIQLGPATKHVAGTGGDMTSYYSIDGSNTKVSRALPVLYQNLL